MADWLQKYSLTSGIDYVVDGVGDRPGITSVRVTIRLLTEPIAEGMEKRVEAGIVKYCAARLRGVEQAAAEDRSRGWLMMAFSVFAVFVLVWVAQKSSGSGETPLGVASEGLSIAAWVMLWHPLWELVFNCWDYRRNRSTVGFGRCRAGPRRGVERPGGRPRNGRRTTRRCSPAPPSASLLGTKDARQMTARELAALRRRRAPKGQGGTRVPPKLSGNRNAAGRAPGACASESHGGQGDGDIALSFEV